MRKFSTRLILILLVGCIALPIFPVIAKPIPAAPPIFKIGTTGGAMGNWDGPAATAGFAGADYGPMALEPLMMQPVDWDGGYDTYIPALATDWTIINWPNDTGYYTGWDMSGGIKAIEFTLREGVTFHDGSNFNATVAKWNIDRNFVISGNLTGELTVGMIFSDFYKSLYSWWLSAWEWMGYETTTWNVSKFLYQPAAYAEWGTTQSLVWNNTGEYTEWQYEMFESVYPRIKNVTILEDLPSGGKIRVNYNDWTGVMDYISDATMISMDAYRYGIKDYTGTPVYGLGDVPGFEQPDVTGGVYPDPDVEFPGHLIGTGPYRFIEHSEVLQTGTMLRYEDWWNSTAMQANGWHEVDQLAIVTFPESDLGFSQQNTAMVTGTIDYAPDGGNLVYNDMIVDPDINYIDVGVGADRIFITLNGINETYWKTWADGGSPTYNLSDPAGPAEMDMSYLHDIDDDGTVHTDGVDRVARKAVSYAFDYDLYISNILEGRGVRSGGFLGVNNEYYNPSIPIAYRNLTIARQALLDDPYWNATCFARGLTVANLTDDQAWIDVANSNPIFEFKLLWDLATYDLANLFGDSIKDIGMVLGGLNGAPDGNLLIQPDVYTVLYSDDLPTVPWFTTHGVPSSWPGINYDMIPVLEYYVASPGDPGFWTVFPLAAKTNLGFHYNDSVDEWIKKGWFADRATSQELMDNMTRHFQTYQYSDIFIAHAMGGVAINKDWEYGPLLGFQFVKYVGTEEGDGGVQIPGFQTAILLAFTIVTITGIAYSLKRRTKRTKRALK